MKMKWAEEMIERLLDPDYENDPRDYRPQDEPICPKCGHNNAMLLGSDLIRECRDCHYREERRTV